MKKLIVIIILIIPLLAGVYLNRAYARIFNTIGAAALVSPDRQQTYNFKSEMTTSKNIIYVSLGDSLTAGVGIDDYAQSYPYLLAQKMAESGSPVTLKNWSLPGARTADLIDQLLAPALKEKPDIVTLLIGVNDIDGNVPAEKFKSNYEFILARLARSGAKVYLINIPYIGADTLFLPPYAAYFDLRTREHNAIIKELAGKYKAVYVDLYSPTVATFKKAGAHYSADQFHPSADGYRLWAEIIAKNL